MQTPTMIAYILISFGFVYFLVDVSISYFERQVVSETLLERDADVEFPTITFCYSPVISMKRFSFLQESDPRPLRNTSNYQYDCQIRISKDLYPKDNRTLSKCPYEMYSRSLAEQINEPFRSSAEVINSARLYSTKGGFGFSRPFAPSNFSHEVIYRDSMRCYTSFPKPEPFANLDTRTIFYNISVEMGLAVGRLALSPTGHLPRGNYYYDMNKFPWSQFMISRIAINSLPHPFPSNCRNYLDDRLDSRAHCVEACVIARSEKFVYKTITYKLNESKGLLFPPTQNTLPSLDVTEQCSKKCSQIDCRTEYYSVKTVKNSETRLFAFAMKSPLITINNSPKIELYVYFIYIGDLLASFFGLSVIGSGMSIVNKLLKSRCSNAPRLNLFRRKYRLGIRKMIRYQILILCFCGTIYQSNISIMSYLEYGTVTQAQFENSDSSRFPKITICLARTLSYEFYKDMRVFHLLQVYTQFPLHAFVDNITIADSTTGRERIHLSQTNLSGLSISHYIRDGEPCYMLEINEEYQASEYKLKQDFAVKMKFKQVVNLNPSFTFGLYGTGDSWEAHRHYGFRINSKEFLAIEFDRFKKQSLPFPYSMCINPEDIGLHKDDNCRSRCMSQFWSSQAIENNGMYSMRYFTENFMNAFVDIKFNLSLFKTRRSICNTKCKLDFCFEDTIKSSVRTIYKRKFAYYDLAYDSLPTYSTQIVMSPKMELTDLVVYLSGIISLWFSLNFSNTITYINRILNACFSVEKNVVSYLSHAVFVCLFLVQLSTLADNYLSYITVMQVDVRYEQYVEPPSVSFCFSLCYLLYKGTYLCNERLEELGWQGIIAAVDRSLPLFNYTKIRDPSTLEWAPLYFNMSTMQQYVEGRTLCYANQGNRLKYDFSKSLILNSESWLKASVNEKFKKAFEMKAYYRDFKFEDRFNTDFEKFKGCKPYFGYPNFIWSKCEVQRYKTSLLPHPYNTDCYMYNKNRFHSQADCYRQCVNSLNNVTKSTEIIDKDYFHLRSMNAEKFKTYSNKCTKRCRRRDCTLEFAHFRQVELIDQKKTMENLAYLYINTKLYETSYSPKMAFSEFVIYLLTYLGILLGIDALILKALVERIDCCN